MNKKSYKLQLKLLQSHTTITKQSSQTVISRLSTLHELSDGSAVAHSRSVHLYNPMIKRDPLVGRGTLANITITKQSSSKLQNTLIKPFSHVITKQSSHMQSQQQNF
jgi:hypothetical protein